MKVEMLKQFIEFTRKRGEQWAKYDSVQGDNIRADFENCAKHLEKCLELMQGGVTVSVGWTLVPIEPTEEMVADAIAVSANQGNLAQRIKAIYKAMIKEAPQTPREGE